ncbi:MAG: phytoene/squalene synthase family protein [Polyangia bacterium]
MSRSAALSLPECRGQSTADAVIRQGRREARAILATGSKSFALAGILLGRRARNDAAVLYAWCRRADDRVDEAGVGGAQSALHNLARELDALSAGRAQLPLDMALSELVERRRIPKEYFASLLHGFDMDARGFRYATLADLDLYAYRVAGVVGLMMCHVLGVRDGRCLKAAARLGMAMQLTNIARDVAEDFRRGRQYLPRELLSSGDLGRALAATDERHPSRRHVAGAVEALLRRADAYYMVGLAGLRDLGARDAMAIGAAARIYRAIGKVIARRRFDSLRTRAVVSLPRKLLLAAAAALALLGRAPTRSSGTEVPDLLVRFDDVET